MSITFTGTGGLFTRMGRFGRMANDMRVYQLDVGTVIESLMEQFETEDWRQYVQQVPQADLNARASAETIMSTLAPAAQAALIAQVAADQPSAGGSLGAALVEVIGQMPIGTPATVQACTVTASTASASQHFGNGVIVASPKRGDGLVQELIYPEVAPILCSNDAQTGSATAGQEQFSYVGGIAEPDVWAWDYPIGSGVSTTFNAIDATQSASGGNVLTNSDFELFTSNLPNQWTKVAGTAGIDFKQSTGVFYDGASSLQLVGGGTAPDLTQNFNNASSGTAGVLIPLSSYAINLVVQVDVIPAAGVLTIDLYDTAAAAVVQDAQGNNNSIAIALHSIPATGTWYNLSLLLGISAASGTNVFRLPAYVTPTTVLRIHVTTGISSGTNVFIDHLGMGALTRTYNGGPGVAIFSGNKPFIQGDGWYMTTTNDFGGSSNLATFQWLFDRLFNMRNLGLLLPSAASSPTIADTLITS